MGIFSGFDDKKGWLFVGGLAAGLLLPSVLRAETTHRAAVSVLAKGLCVKDEAMVRYETIREEAQDVYAEAKLKAAEDDGPEEENE